MADELLLDALLRAWAEHHGVADSTAHDSIQRATEALVGGASLSEAFRVGRGVLDGHGQRVPAAAHG